MAGMSEAVRKAFLRQIPLFAELGEEELQVLSRAAIPNWARSGTPILREGADATCLIVLTSGRAKVVIAGQRGQDIILAIIEPLSVVGEIALLDRSPRSATVIALERTEYMEIPVKPFAGLFESNRVFAEKIARHLASTLRQANDQLRAICTLPSDRRVAWCLRRIAGQRGQRHGTSIVIRPRPLQQEIADMTACSRETVSRALRTLRQKNCAIPDGDGLRIQEGINRYLRDDLWLSGSVS